MLLRARLRLLREPGRGFFQDLPLFTERPVLASQPDQLLTLLGRQAVSALAVIQVGLADPVPDRLRRGLELPSQFLGRLSGAHQLDQAAAKLREVWRGGGGPSRPPGGRRAQRGGVPGNRATTKWDAGLP